MRVLVKEKIADSGVELLRENFEVDLGLEMSEQELREAIGGYDAILVRSATQLTPELIERAANLKVIGRAGTGVDNVDIEAATRRGIIVANAPESNSIAAAEHTMALMLALCRALRDTHSLGVVTNDIFTREDMEFLVRSEALTPDRIIGVQTGGCPHTAIREDASMNFEALDAMSARHPGLDIVFLESGGDNLAASFSPELVDASIYVIDVSGGDKIPRKGGPGVTRSDLLVINKTDLAPHVGADLDVMARDAKLMRGDRPFLFTNLKRAEGLPDVVAWIQRELLYEDRVIG